MLGQRGDALVLAPQLVAELAVGLALAAVELAHELGHLVELAGHGDELLVDQRLLAVELGARAHPLLLEERLVGLEQPVEGLVVGVALLVGEARHLLGQRRDLVDGRGHIDRRGRPAGEHDGQGSGRTECATDDDSDDEGHVGDRNDRVRQLRGLRRTCAGPRSWR